MHDVTRARKVGANIKYRRECIGNAQMRQQAVRGSVPASPQHTLCLGNMQLLWCTPKTVQHLHAHRQVAAVQQPMSVIRNETTGPWATAEE
jgi:hypothetical protein